MTGKPYSNVHILLALLIVGQFSHAAYAQESEPEISINVHLDSSAEVRAWDVVWKAKGLDPKQSNYQLQLSDWGEWSRADSLFLRNLKSSIPIEKTGDSCLHYKIVPPKNWDGSIEVSYRILMMDRHSSARDNFGLMPWYDKSYGQGYTSNTLMDLFVDGTAVQAKRKINFIAKPDELIVSGWGKSSTGKQTAELNEPIGNTIVLFGTPVRAPVSTEDSSIEIIQFGEAAAFPDSVIAKISTVNESFKKSTGLKAGDLKLVFTDTYGGGINVDGALVVGYGQDGIDNQSVLMTMAHELFHEWLGGGFVQVKNPEAVWFQEGFTDYLSLWHLAHCGLITDQQFVDRLVQIKQELKNNSSYGSISFGDAGVNWRDGGPNEQLAYRAAALLAFCTDVELRKNGHPGLSKMISDMAGNKTVIGNDEIQQWYLANGLDQFHSNFIANPQPADFESALLVIGCEHVDIPVAVAYAGFNNDNDGPFGHVADVDPNGPAAKAGIKTGDMIQGFWPSEERKFNLLSADELKFKYGITRFPVDQTINFDVERDGRKINLKFKPETLNNVATQRGFKANPAKMKSFLSTER